MSSRFVVLQAAKREAIEARRWYAAKDLRIVPKFLAELDRTFVAVRTRPRTFSYVELPYRFAPVRRFPYYVVFEITDEATRVIAVCHERRDLGYWRDRGGDAG